MNGNKSLIPIHIRHLQQFFIADDSVTALIDCISKASPKLAHDKKFLSALATLDTQHKNIKKNCIKYETFLNSLPCAVCKVRYDPKLPVLYANSEYFNLLGYTELPLPDFENSSLQHQYPRHTYSTHYLPIYAPDIPVMQEGLQTVPDTQDAISSFEIRLLHTSGNIINVQAQCLHTKGRHECTCVFLDISARKAQNDALRASEEKYRLAIQHTDKTIFYYEIPTRTIILPPELAQLMHVPQRLSNAPYSIVEAGYVADESVTEYLRLFDCMNKGDPRGTCVVCCRNEHGVFAWLRMDFSVVFSKVGHPHHAILTYEDVTNQREKELAYEKWQQYNDSQLAGSIGYYECNLTKDIFERLDGPMSAQLPQTVRDSYSSVFNYVAKNFVHSDDQANFISIFSREALLSSYHRGEREISFEHRRIAHQGATVWAISTLQLLPDPYSNDIKTFGLIKDIDRQKKETLKLQERSQYDALTGLLNRGATIEQVTALLESSGESCKHTFMMVDIDNFKSLNDSLGHQFGDKVLTDVATDLKSVLRSDDIIGRLGGDEFVICLKNMAPSTVLQEKATLLRSLLFKEFDKNTIISGSIGISLFPRDGLVFTDLYQKADIALYEAKKYGRNQYVFFQPHMENTHWQPYNNTPIDPHTRPVADGPSTPPNRKADRGLPSCEPHDLLFKYYNIALRNTYDELFELNLTRNTYRIVYHVPHKYVIPAEEGSLPEMIEEVATHMIHPDDGERFLKFCDLDAARKKLENGAESVSGEFRKKRCNGEFKWASLVLIPMGNDNEEELILCLIIDIAEKKQTEEIAHQNSLLRQRQLDDERYRIIVEQTGTIVLEYNATAQSIYTSPEALQFSFAENLSAQLDHRFLTPQDVHPDDWFLFESASLAIQQGRSKAENTLRLRKVNGQYLWCKVAITIVRADNAALKRSIVTINDVDSAIKDRKSLEYRAEYDDLTGYYNFSKFKIDVAHLLTHRGESKYSLWYCDLRNFKLVNDIYGYDIGDRVLQYFAKITAEDLLPGEVFARVSADHFVVLRLYYTVEDLYQRFHATSDLLANYAELAGKKLHLEMVSGIYCVEREEDILSIEDMLDRANIAQKSVKNLSGSRFALYTEKMRNQLLLERSIEADMHEALIHREFCVFLQPLVDIQRENHIIGAEALVRWNRPQTGLMYPSEFISLFEKNGFIVDLDSFVFEEVCSYLQKRKRAGKSLLKISVNVSRVSVFRNDFMARYIAIKQRYGIPDGLLELECTETTMVENASQLNRVMSRMRSNGFLLSLDDFGSGYSSLNMLKDVTVDILKLDMMFFSSNIHARRDWAIISSIIGMARALDMKIVAEGVESTEQLATLRELGCDVVQGFLFGRAVPFEEFESLYLNEG